MTQDEATQLLVSAASAASQLVSLIPSLVANLAAAKEGLATDDLNALNDKIAGAHADIQTLDAKLAAIRGN